MANLILEAIYQGDTMKILQEILEKRRIDRGPTYAFVVIGAKG
ncbi:hypothetical protein [Desulfosporosinus acididurans]|nr:hypothetical protein [Desulfosporosinus acididurans]